MNTSDIKNQDQFEALAKTMIKWMNENVHPHCKIIIDQTSAELVEGIKIVHTTEFLKD